VSSVCLVSVCVQGFFRRMLKEQLHKKFICTSGDNCEIASANRTNCKTCRFAKCLRVGMTLEGAFSVPGLSVAGWSVSGWLVYQWVVYQCLVCQWLAGLSVAGLSVGGLSGCNKR